MIVSSSGPSNVTGYVGWVQDPNGRGTGGLLLSCIITLSMCVWSALHLNIPQKQESRLQYLARNARWVVMGVFVPELVVLAAWRQWTSARSLSVAVRGLYKDHDTGTELCRTTSTASYARAADGRSGWTSAHSHFAGMGGFAFDISHNDLDSSRYLPQDVTRLTLTTHGVLLLARCGHLPYLDITELDDKSKADGLAKTLVMLQAGWMLAQTIGRLVVGLPMSLLEVNTLGHVLCAFVIYVLWWSKPREVYEPMVVTGDWVDKIAAYMYMSSRISGEDGSSAMVPRVWRTPELSQFKYSPSCGQDGDDIGTFKRKIQREDTLHTASNKRRFRSISRAKVPIEVSITTDLSEKQIQARTNSNVNDSIEPPSHTPLSTRPDASSTQQCDQSIPQRRQRLALEAIRDFPAISERFKSPSTPRLSTSAEGSEHLGHASHATTLEPEVQQLVVPTASNWPSDYLMGRMRGQTMGMALWFASMAYGGVHVAAWNEHFPTPAERYMWHLSSVYIACSGAFWFALNVFAFFCPWAKTWFRKFREMKVHWIQVLLLGLGATVCGCLYVFARVFLVVEAIISLRNVPARVYATPNWTDVFPHL